MDLGWFLLEELNLNEMNFFWCLSFCLVLGIQIGGAEIKPLAEYENGSRVWLSTTIGEVVVNPEFPIFSNITGEIDWKVQDGELVKEGQVLFMKNPEKLDLSLRDLKLKEQQYSNNLIDIENAILNEKLSISKSRKEIAGMYDSLKTTETERRLLGEEFEKKLQGEREGLQMELSKLDEKIKGEYFENSLKSQIESLDLELDKMKFAHSELVRESTEKAETDGRLTIELRKSDDIGIQVGKIRKEGLHEVVVNVADRMILNTEKDRLEIEVRSDDGSIFVGKFKRLFSDETFARGESAYVFSLVPSGGVSGEVPDSFSGKRLLKVFKTFDVEGYLIPKDPLLMAYPEEIGSIGWTEFLKERLPEGKLTFIGPRELFVSKYEN